MARKYETKKVKAMFKRDYQEMQFKLADLFDRVAEEYLKGNTTYYEAVIDQVLDCLEEVEDNTAKEVMNVYFR